MSRHQATPSGDSIGPPTSAPSDPQSSASAAPETLEEKILLYLRAELFLEALFYPLEYVSVLMQIGYEPEPRTISTTLFYGQAVEIKPNGFKYIKHIYEEDGFFGCYKGLSARLFGITSSCLFSSRLLNLCGMHRLLPEIWDPPNIINNDVPIPEHHFKCTCRSLLLHAASVVVSHPFHVVSMRMMSSFVGKEEHYSSFFYAFASVYRDNGILGYYHGIVPRLIGNLTCIGLAGVLTYFVNKHFVKTKEFRSYTSPAMIVVTSELTFTFNVISVCMAVTGSSLKVGNPPNMPIYNSFLECGLDLYNTNEYRRGSSLVYRYV